MKTPLTERIEAAIARRGLFKGVAAELAGMKPSLLDSRCRRGDWKDWEVAMLARVLRVPLESLTEEGRHAA